MQRYIKGDMYIIIRYDNGDFKYTLREEPSQINVILQQKLQAAKLSTVCTIHKQ